MKSARVCSWIATLGPIGYLNAPGTVAALVTIPFVYWLHAVVPGEFWYVGLVAGAFVISFFIINNALEFFKRYEDPAEIVLDEVIGCLITFWGISLSLPTVIVGFILFRFFDVIKIGMVKECEGFVGARGILLDDVMAALISNLILRCIY